MKKYLKNKDGLALPMVLIIIVILSILSLSLATYAHQSLRSVKYMNAQKQAYYLARVGVEAGAYAFQSAALKTTDAYTDYHPANYDGVDAIVSALQDIQCAENASGEYESSAGKVTSNKIYLVYSDSNSNDDTPWEGLAFVTEDDIGSIDTTTSVIGYFSIEAMGAQNVVVQNAIDDDGNEILDADGNNVKTEVAMNVVEFRSTAVCFDGSNNEVKEVVHGFVYPTEQVTSNTIYDSDGLLSQDDSVFSNAETETIVVNATDGPTKPTTSGIQGFLDRIVYYAKRLWNGIIKGIFTVLYPDGWSTEIEGYQYVSGGDIIFGKPSNSEFIKTHANENNIYSLTTSGNMYIEAGFDVIPNKGKFSTVGLFANDIIIDGDIKMGVYINNPDLALGGLSSIISTFGNRYRLGTVIIGSGSKSGGNYQEFIDVEDGGITTKDGALIQNANRIFFNGNVTLTVYMQGSTTETYRIFTSGDVCLFNGLYANDESVDEDSDSQARGIDLVKFFVDSVVDGDPLFAKYGDAVRERLEAVRDTYYGDPDDTENPGEPSYIQTDASGNVTARPLRVINVNRFASTADGTGMLIDGCAISTQVGNYYLWQYIAPPAPSQSSNINWGKPLLPANFDQ